MLEDILQIELDDVLITLADLYNLNTTFFPLQNDEEYENFLVIIDELLEVSDNYHNPSYHRIHSKRFIPYLIQFFNTILGSNYNDKLENYSQLHHINPEIASGVYYELDHIQNKAVPENIFLHGNRHTSDLIEAIHEYTHAFLFEHYEVLGNIYNTELLSIFMEKIGAIYFEQKGLERNFLNRINWERIYDIKEAYCNFRDLGRSNMYLLSDIYATALFEQYKENSKTVVQDVIHVLDGKDNIPNLLQDYKISLANDQTIQTYQKTLRQYR